MSVAEMFAAYRERLFRFIRSRVRLLEDAEDILEETFYQAARMENAARPI